LCNRWIYLSFPTENSLPGDIINLILDDEYGLRQMQRKPRTILDVGANIGLFSLLARHYFPAAIIHAYEPNPRVLEFTRGNMVQVGLAPHAFAVGLKEGLAVMVDQADSLVASTRASEQGDVLVKALREMVADIGGQVDLLKLDCEGAEWEVFRDVETMARIDTIRMEYHLNPRQTLQQFLSLVSEAGFRVELCLEKRNHGILWLHR
jgi:FkbM family methyltransferase